MPGQPQLDTNPYFGVDASDLVVRDPTGGPSDFIIRRGDPFSLELTLRFGGSLAPLVLFGCVSVQGRGVRPAR